MATVGNRYFNSPWLAQAAGNLTDALFGSPERDYQRLQSANLQQQLERQKAADVEAGQERIRGENANAALANLVSAPEDSVPAALSDVLRLGGAGMAPVAFQAAGASSPTFRAKMALQDDKQAAAQQLRDQQIDSMIKIAMLNQGGQNQRADQTDTRYRDLAAQNEQLQREMAQLRGTQQQAHDARAGGGAPLDVSPADRSNIGYDLEEWARRYGGEIPAEMFNPVRQLIQDRYQQTRNTSSADEVLAYLFGRSPTFTPATESHAFGLFGKDAPASLATAGNAPLEQLIARYRQQFMQPQQPQQAAAPAAPQGAGGNDLGAIITRLSQQAQLPQQAQVAAPAQAPPAAIDYLRAHPETRAAFQQKYGYLPPGM